MVLTAVSNTHNHLQNRGRVHLMEHFTKQLSATEIAFFHLVEKRPEFWFALLPERIEGNTGYFRRLEGGNLLGKQQSYYSAAMRGIATFHHYTRDVHIDFLPRNQDYYEKSLRQTMEYAARLQISLPEERLRELEASLPLLTGDIWVIHDDFLPQNVMVDGSGIKIIDWAELRYGFPEHDVGRFLGDIAADTPQWQKKYYPTEWKPTLIQQYLDTRGELDPTYDSNVGRSMIRLGELWNYLGPIEMCLKDGDTQSDWFRENLRGFQNL